MVGNLPSSPIAVRGSDRQDILIERAVVSESGTSITLGQDLKSLYAYLLAGAKCRCTLCDQKPIGRSVHGDVHYEDVSNGEPHDHRCGQTSLISMPV